MPLLDHFHPPIYPVRHWESLHAVWLTSIMARLNQGILPPNYFAEAQVHVGSRFEVDVGSFEETTQESLELPTGGGTAVAVEPRVWLAPPPVGTLPAVFPDSLEGLIYADEGGAILAGAIEMVSPGNKDRAATREAFVAKCASYLQQGVGVVIVDIVTSRLANLHEELSNALGGSCPLPKGSNLYATAYRPVRRPDTDHHEVWTYPLALGEALPIVPLALRRGPIVPVDLESAYREACQRSRLG